MTSRTWRREGGGESWRVGGRERERERERGERGEVRELESGRERVCMHIIHVQCTCMYLRM